MKINEAAGGKNAYNEDKKKSEIVVMDVYTHIIEEKEDVTDVVNQILIL